MVLRPQHGFTPGHGQTLEARCGDSQGEDCVVYTERWIGGAINCHSATEGIQVGKPRPLLFPDAVFS